MNRFSTAACIAITLLSIGASAQAQTVSDCTLPTQPIIPDGNVASMDELVAAQNAFKMYQGHLGGYRTCLLEAEAALSKDSEDLEESTAKITKLYDGSVDAETVTAEKFNESVRAYNARNPKTEE
jgi:hypothetical protein